MFQDAFEWCVKGKLQMEVMPDNDKFQYLETGNELSPVCVLYCDIECYIEEDTQRHMPAAIACLEKWHSGVSHADEMHVWSGENCIVNFLRFVTGKLSCFTIRKINLVKNQCHIQMMIRKYSMTPKIVLHTIRVY